MKFNTKTLGKGLVILAVSLIILLSFVKVNSDNQSAALCELTYESGMPMTNCPFHNNPNSWLIITAFGVGFAILSLGLYLSFQSKFKTKLVDFKIINSDELDDEEKTIYEFIKNKEGSVYQSDLVKGTEFSKVKVTRILDRLETKDIVERKRRGMTNIVILK